MPVSRADRPPTCRSTTYRPLLMMTMRVQMRSTTSRMCEENRIVLPCAGELSSAAPSRPSPRSRRGRRAARRESARRADGCSAEAMTTFWRMPFENSFRRWSLIAEAEELEQLRRAASRRRCRIEVVQAARRARGIRRPSGCRRARRFPARSRCASSPRAAASTTSKPETRRVPAVGPDQAGQNLDRRRLAGAVRPEEAENLAGLDLAGRESMSAGLPS